MGLDVFHIMKAKINKNIVKTEIVWKVQLIIRQSL